MPIYDYHCLGCGKDFEQYTTDYKKKTTKCPKCNFTARKKISLGADRSITWAKECRLPGRTCKLPEHIEKRQRKNLEKVR